MPTNYTPSQVYNKYVALQKQLATNITNKGVTASQTELYDNLIDKVAQIENLKGEERTLENFTNILDKPNSIVQLEYPNDTPKTLNAKLVTVNLFTPNTTPTVLSNMGVTCTYDSTDNTFTINGTLANEGNINLATLNIPLDDYYIVRYYVSGDITVPESVAYRSLFSMFVYGSSSQYLDRLSQTVANYNTPQIAIEAKNRYSVESADKWTFYMQNFGVGTVFDNYKFKIAIIKKNIYYTGIPFTPYISDFSTVNVTRCRKNLIPYPYLKTTQTISGVTFTANSDGSITVNGTATANAIFEFESDSTMFTLPAGNYFLSGCPSGGSATSYLMTAVNGAGSSYDKYQRDFGTGVAVPSKGEKWKVSIRIMSGYTANNLVFKPQIELGSTATSYEPYQGQTYTPTATGEVTGITNLYPTTTLLTNNAGVVFEQVTGQTYKEILPSTDKNGITKVYQPSVDSTIDSNIKPENIKKDVSILGVTGDYICNYTYDETTKELVLIL